MAHKFEIGREIRCEYRRFGMESTQFTVRLNPLTDHNPNPVDNFLTSVNDLFEHVLQDVQDSDMVGIIIRNEINQRHYFQTE
jgi:hypothetical protein